MKNMEVEWQLRCAQCGATRARNGNEFTPRTLRVHAWRIRRKLVAKRQVEAAVSTSIQSVTTGADNFTGTYQAAGTLSAFNGSQANGNWMLFFADLSSGGGQSMLTLAGLKRWWTPKTPGA